MVVLGKRASIIVSFFNCRIDDLLFSYINCSVMGGVPVSTSSASFEIVLYPCEI